MGAGFKSEKFVDLLATDDTKAKEVAQDSVFTNFDIANAKQGSSDVGKFKSHELLKHNLYILVFIYIYIF